jgi:hypothetical protein
MKRRGFVISASTETEDPNLAVQRYERELARFGISVKNHRVMVFGYGDYFGIAVSLLRREAGHVYLCDKYTTPDNRKNFDLYETFPEYFLERNGIILPDSEHITLINQDIRTYVQHTGDLEVDIIFSSAVLEHVEDVEETISALAGITAPDGMHVHFVDLRDHYFKYPFQMLVYTKNIWDRFLKANHLNRLRLGDYEIAFNRYFDNVQCRILKSDLDSYLKVKEIIRPEFITGNDQIDSATLIVILASKPLKSATV